MIQSSFSSERTSEDFLTLNSAGIQCVNYRNGGSLRPNGRMDYHILYIQSGRCFLTLDGVTQTVPAGSIILFRPYERQEYHFLQQDASVSHYIHFTGQGCASLLERLGISSLRVFPMGGSRTYEELSAKLVREFLMKSFAWESECAALLWQMLICIARKYDLYTRHIHRPDDRRISDACQYVYAHLSDDISIQALAEDACLSVSRFTHLFREVTGWSFHAYLNFLRMERAKELLCHSNAPIREIAESVGIDDQNYFSRLFRKTVGVSPMAFRKNG